MNRILLSLMIILIALTGIACVSASSDFETVDNDFIVSDINETVIPVDDSADSIDDSVVPTDDIARNDTEECSDPTEIDNSTEPAEEDMGYDNSTEPAEEDNEIAADDLADVYIVAPDDKPHWDKWMRWNTFDVPDVDVRPTTVDSGDEILDAALYYADYYRAYKQAFAFDFSDPLNLMRSLDTVFDLVYKTHDLEESLAIVAKMYCIAELKYYDCDYFVKAMLEGNVYSFLDERFHERYFDPNEYYNPPTPHDSDPNHPIF